jgi:hypothetical protein
MKTIETLKRMMSRLYKSYMKLENKILHLLFREWYGIELDMTV